MRRILRGLLDCSPISSFRFCEITLEFVRPAQQELHFRRPGAFTLETLELGNSVRKALQAHVCDGQLILESELVCKSALRAGEELTGDGILLRVQQGLCISQR